MSDADAVPEGVDPTRPSAARLYDYYLGGTHNYEVDRQTAEQIRALMPELADAAWASVGVRLSANSIPPTRSAAVHRADSTDLSPSRCLPWGNSCCMSCPLTRGYQAGGAAGTAVVGVPGLNGFAGVGVGDGLATLVLDLVSIAGRLDTRLRKAPGHAA